MTGNKAPQRATTSQFLALGEQLSCSCLSFPRRKVGTFPFTSEEHYDHTEFDFSESPAVSRS